MECVARTPPSCPIPPPFPQEDRVKRYHFILSRDVENMYRRWVRAESVDMEGQDPTSGFSTEETGNELVHYLGETCKR